MSKTYPNAEAVGAAVASLSREDARQISAVEVEGGAFEVSGPADILAKLDAAPSKDRLRAYAATKRYAVETGGITVGSSQIATDRESQAMVSGAFNFVQVNPAAIIKFKGADGEFVDLDAAAVTAIASAVGAHVQACFSAEADVLSGIESGLITETADIDAFAWPA